MPVECQAWDRFSIPGDATLSANPAALLHSSHHDAPARRYGECGTRVIPVAGHAELSCLRSGEVGATRDAGRTPRRTVRWYLISRLF